VVVLVVPAIASLSLLSARMSLELIIVIFRIETHLRAMKEKSEKE